MIGSPGVAAGGFSVSLGDSHRSFVRSDRDRQWGEELTGPLHVFPVGPDDAVPARFLIGGILSAPPSRASDEAAGGGGERGIDPLGTARIELRARDGLEIAATTAAAGVWLLAPASELADSELSFSIEDAEGRLRLWLLLPPLRMMVGRAGAWLSEVPSPTGPPRAPFPPHGWRHPHLSLLG